MIFFFFLYFLVPSKLPKPNTHFWGSDSSTTEIHLQKERLRSALLSVHARPPRPTPSRGNLASPLPAAQPSEALALSPSTPFPAGGGTRRVKAPRARARATAPKGRPVSHGQRGGKPIYRRLRLRLAPPREKKRGALHLPTPAPCRQDAFPVRLRTRAARNPNSVRPKRPCAQVSRATRREPLRG